MNFVELRCLSILPNLDQLTEPTIAKRPTSKVDQTNE